MTDAGIHQNSRLTTSFKDYMEEISSDLHRSQQLINIDNAKSILDLECDKKLKNNFR